MGTFLRIAGGFCFLAMIFLPTFEGCGPSRTQFQIAARTESPWGIPIFLGALALGAFAILWPMFAKNIVFWAEGVVMAGAALTFAGLVWLVAVISRNGANVLWTIGVQILGAVLMFAGSLERWRNRRQD